MTDRAPQARTVAGLSHPNIVVLHSVEDDGDVRFLTMELVEGQSLDQHMTTGGLPLARVLDLGIALSDALTSAHEKSTPRTPTTPSSLAQHPTGIRSNVAHHRECPRASRIQLQRLLTPDPPTWIEPMGAHGGGPRNSPRSASQA